MHEYGKPLWFPAQETLSHIFLIFPCSLSSRFLSPSDLIYWMSVMVSLSAQYDAAPVKTETKLVMLHLWCLKKAYTPVQV